VGRQQRLKYQTTLLDAMQTLARYPQLGRSRHTFAPHVRSHHVGEHVILYGIDDVRLTVLRILHQRMDVERALSGQ
jgi:plasmid stabilization system protein ParE